MKNLAGLILATLVCVAASALGILASRPDPGPAALKTAERSPPVRVAASEGNVPADSRRLPEVVREVSLPEEETPEEPPMRASPHTVEDMWAYGTYPRETLEQLAAYDDPLALAMVSAITYHEGDADKGEALLIRLLEVTKNPYYAIAAIGSRSHERRLMPVEHAYTFALVAAGLGDPFSVEYEAEGWRQELGDKEPAARKRAEEILARIGAGERP